METDQQPPRPWRPGRRGKHICPVGVAGWLDGRLRRWLTGTRRLAETYCSEGQTVLDLGCGPAPMLADIARVIGPAGRIICADVQPAMLDRVRAKAERAGLSDRVRLHLCEPDRLGLEPSSVDFVLAFWMLHEADDPELLLDQIAACLRPAGRLLLIEPIIHVSKARFQSMVRAAGADGLRAVESPRVRFSRAALLRK